VDASPPYFLPSYPWPIGTFGAFIRLRQQMPDRRVLFDVGVAGPLAGFVVTLPVLAWGMLTAQVVPLDATGGIEFGEPLLLQGMAWLVGRSPGAGEALLINPAMMAAWVGCLATSLNLLPVGQLDGGHILYAVSRAFHGRMAPVALVVFSLASIAIYPGYLVFAMVLVFVGSRHPSVRDEQGDIGTGRRLIAILALVMLILCFVPGPISLPEITGD
jgi:membrane-associated protease RseP (regulator of RpoE activity)